MTRKCQGFVKPTKISTKLSLSTISYRLGLERMPYVCLGCVRSVGMAGALENFVLVNSLNGGHIPVQPRLKVDFWVFSVWSGA